jgi:hypothetical protein
VSDVNLILKNRPFLKDHHYIVQARAEDYWVGFYSSTLNKRIFKYGNGFNIIFFGDTTRPNDFYSIPYSIMKNIMTGPNLDSHDRWVFSVKYHVLRVHGGNADKLHIGEFYGNLDNIAEVKIGDKKWE